LLYGEPDFDAQLEKTSIGLRLELYWRTRWICDKGSDGVGLWSCDFQLSIGFLWDQNIWTTWAKETLERDHWK